jgi:hypothetical protein
VGKVKLIEDHSEEPLYAKGSEAWAEQIQEYARRLAEDIDRGFMKLAEYIWLIYDTPVGNDPGNGPFYKQWGYQTVEQWARHELGISNVRKVQYLRQIYYTLQQELITEGGVEQDVIDKLLRLGYSQLRVLCPILTADNAREWADRTEGLSYRQIDDLVRKFRDLTAEAEAAKKKAAAAPAPTDAGDAPRKDEGPPVKVKPVADPPTPTITAAARLESMRFLLTPESKEIVDEAMRTSAAVTGSDKPGYLLSMICLDFLATNGGAKKGNESFYAYLANLERLFQVRLVALDFDEPPGEDLLYGRDTVVKMIDRFQGENDADD